MSYFPWIAGGAALGLAARGRRAPVRWAYHITTAHGLEDIRWHGLIPHARLRATQRDTPLLFFEATPEGAASWAGDREFEALLRFPWPADAENGYPDVEWVTTMPVPPEHIQIADTPALDPLVDVYYAHPEERGLPVLHWAEVARSWRPLKDYR